VPLREAEGGGSWNVVGRLGNTEFFIEESGDAPAICALESLAVRGFAGAWPVLREDRALVLGGPAARAALAEVCNVDFDTLRGERPVVMTSMIGIGVLVLPQVSDDEGPIYRIWCDPSYGSYLWSELEEIVTRIETGSNA
jgi:sarcosine oxidase subunit gamma